MYFTLTVAKSLWLWLQCEEWRQGGHPGLRGNRWQLPWARRVDGLGCVSGTLGKERNWQGWGGRWFLSGTPLLSCGEDCIASQTIQVRLRRPSPPPGEEGLSWIKRRGALLSSHPKNKQGCCALLSIIVHVMGVSACLSCVTHSPAVRFPAVRVSPCHSRQPSVISDASAAEGDRSSTPSDINSPRHRTHSLCNVRPAAAGPGRLGPAQKWRGHGVG